MLLPMISHDFPMVGCPHLEVVVPGTGIAASISSNRTSYIFGTKGPSLTPLGAEGMAVGRGTLTHEFSLERPDILLLGYFIEGGEVKSKLPGKCSGKLGFFKVSASSLKLPGCILPVTWNAARCDTACSSSLVAADAALSSLRRGTSEAAT